MFPELLVDGMFIFSPRAEGIGAKVIRTERIYFWIIFGSFLDHGHINNHCCFLGVRTVYRITFEQTIKVEIWHPPDTGFSSPDVVRRRC
jgi:hypothetical protein